MKFPKALGACADRLFTVRQLRLKLQKDVDAVAEEERALKEHLINTLPKSEASGVAGKLCRVAVVDKEVPRIGDWSKFYEFVKESGQFDLLQRRLSDTAIAARWEEGEEVPGVERFHVPVVSINKL